jgi:hypothetical protein
LISDGPLAAGRKVEKSGANAYTAFRVPDASGGAIMTAARTSYGCAIEGYDDEFERALVDAIMTAITQASMVTDANACVIRTGETASALVTVLAGMLAMSPAAARSPTAIRKTIDELGKRLRRNVARQPLTLTSSSFLPASFTSTTT